MTWCKWWAELQPVWHRGDAWPPSRVVQKGETWSSLGKSGRDGFVLVILTLSWWSQALKVESQHEEFDIAVEDALWVVSQLLLEMPHLSKKRALEDSEASLDQPRSKR